MQCVRLRRMRLATVTQIWWRSGSPADRPWLGKTATVIREARSTDFDGVMRLYRQLHADDPVLDDGTDRTVFEQILATPSLHLLVLERDRFVVATTYLNVIPNITRSAAPYAVIENVVVDEQLRGTGLGKRIMAATLRTAWDADCYKAMLMTGSERPSTHAFYRTCGFSADPKTAFLARPLPGAAMVLGDP